MSAKETPSKSLPNVRPTRFFTRRTEERPWVLVDADGQSVGRIATQIASALRGKTSARFTPHDDVGPFVVVVNAEKVQFRGNDKAKKKKYYRHTGYLGHLREVAADKMLEKRPEMVLRLAVKGMLPRGALGSRMLKKLKIYAGAEHPHAAQKPVPWQEATLSA